MRRRANERMLTWRLIAAVQAGVKIEKLRSRGFLVTYKGQGPVSGPGMIYNAQYRKTSQNPAFIEVTSRGAREGRVFVVNKKNESPKMTKVRATRARHTTCA